MGEANVNFDRVQPGDLITSEFLNRVLDEIRSLGARVTVLEASAGGPATGGAPFIDAISPSGAVAVGQEIRVSGGNFGAPANLVVTVDGIKVNTFKPGSSGALLIFNVPLVQGATSAGKLVALTVSHPTNGFASTTLVVTPAVSTVPTGSVQVFLTQAPPSPILPGNRVVVFTVRGISTLNETYAVEPRLTADDPGWKAVVVDAADQPLEPPEVPIPRGDPPNGSTRDVRVLVSVPANPPNATAQLRLAVQSKLNPGGLSGSTGNNLITVGEDAPPVQDLVKFALGTVSAPGRKVGNVVEVPTTETEVPVRFNVTFKEAGSYDLKAPTFGDNVQAFWAARALSSTTVKTTTPDAVANVRVGVTAREGAEATDMVLQFTRTGNPAVIGENRQPVRPRLDDI